MQRVRPTIVKGDDILPPDTGESSARGAPGGGSVDRVELFEAIIQELSTILAEELRAAGPELLRADLDGIEARLQAVSRRVCGATLERVLSVRAVPRGECPPCPTRGGTPVPPFGRARCA
jgi:hypothetical protein